MVGLTAAEPAPVSSPLQRLAGFTLACFVASLASILLGRHGAETAAPWYANAIGAALLMSRPLREWPALLAAAAGANLAAQGVAASGWSSLAVSLLPVHVLEMLLAGWSLRLSGLADSDLRSPWSLLRLLVVGALLPPLAAAVPAALIVAGQGLAPFERAWLHWFEAGTIGALSMLPLACLVQRLPPGAVRAALFNLRQSALSFVAVAVALASLQFVSFPFVVLAIPLLLAAMTLEFVASAWLTLLVSMTVAAAMELGIFMPPQVPSDWHQLYLYLAYAAALVPSLLLAASVAELRDGHASLLASRQELKVAHAGLEQFVHMASHDLREPLNTIAQFSELIEADHGPDLPPDAHRYLGLVRQASTRMRRLLDDVLQVARVQRGQPGTPQPVALERVLEQARTALAGSLQTSGGTITSAPLPVVMGHEGLLVQLLQNLIGNALKFVAPGVVPQVHVSARPDGDWVRLTVADNGIGIHEADLPKLFLPFQRLHLRRHYEGNGLGLSLARQIAQAQGGDIEVESTPGRGSRFSVRLRPASTAAAR